MDAFDNATMVNILANELLSKLDPKAVVDNKITYGRMPPGDMEIMMAAGERELLAALSDKMERGEDLSAADQDRLGTPITKLGVAFQMEYGPQYTLDSPSKAFADASPPSADADSPNFLQSLSNPSNDRAMT